MKRNYGIDLLRVAAMFFVAALHIIGIGGIITGSALLSPQFLTAQLLRICMLCAVNCYALISGFVGWERRPKWSSLALLWLKALLFCVCITVFFAGRHALDFRTAVSALIPVTTSQYWYLTAYAGLFVLLPILNGAVRNMPKQELKITLFGIFLLFSILPISPLTDAFQLHDGYSVLWLAALYLLGGYWGKYGTLARLSRRAWLGIFALCILLAWAPRMAVLWLRPHYWYDAYGNILIEYTSPTIVLAAAALLAVFSRTEPGQRARGIIARLAPHAFGVYLFHAHPLMFRYALENRFAHLGTGSIGTMIATVFGAAAAICAAGFALDWLVSAGLKATGLRRLLEKLDRFTE